MLSNWIMHYWQTTTHKAWVAYYMLRFSARLTWRAVVHDLSKYTPSESEGFVRNIRRLRTTTYGTPEYKALLDDIKPSIALHYARNSHHPEHYDNGISDMDMADVVEMLCDWRAAVRRHADGDVKKSILSNTARFSIPLAMADVFRNECD